MAKRVEILHACRIDGKHVDPGDVVTLDDSTAKLITTRQRKGKPFAVELDLEDDAPRRRRRQRSPEAPETGEAAKPEAPEPEGVGVVQPEAQAEEQQSDANDAPPDDEKPPKPAPRRRTRAAKPIDSTDSD